MSVLAIGAAGSTDCHIAERLLKIARGTLGAKDLNGLPGLHHDLTDHTDWHIRKRMTPLRASLAPQLPSAKLLGKAARSTIAGSITQITLLLITPFAKSAVDVRYSIDRQTTTAAVGRR